MTVTLFFLSTIAITSVSAQEKPQKPPIVSRKEWNAKKPVGKVKKHTIRFITVHHTGTRQKPDVSIEKKLQNLQAFSQRDDKLASGKLKPAWFDVPYHYYIATDGRIAEGRKIKYVGDTNTEYDPTGHALVVVEGSFNTEEPTKEQIESLKKMIDWLAHKYRVPAANLKGHDDYAKTACPGEKIKDMLPAFQEQLKR
jgi:N-acetyl-anhydromuramyl-L-alanine amidase AmpD